MALSSDLVAELNAAAAEHFRRSFAGSPAETYVRSRGLTDETIAAWQIGYAPPGNGLLKLLVAQGWPESTLDEAGLVRIGERGTSDFFRHRVMLPIIDRDGRRVLAFGSRRLADDDERNPKYLNSPETALFRKTETLYGWPNADAARTAGEVLLVEGNFDMLSLWQAGVRNVMAACGTAVTAEHLVALSELTRRITLVLDADVAGQTAIQRTLTTDGIGELDLGVIVITGGKDPDDILRDGRAAWDALAAARIRRWEWLWRKIMAPYAEHLDADVEQRIAWKDAWTALVRAHAGGRAQGELLLGRMEKRLHLVAGSLAAEYLADMPAEVAETVGRDDMLLAALALDWPGRAEFAPYLTLGKRQAVVRDEWLARKAADPGARVRRLMAEQAELVEHQWRRALLSDVITALKTERGTLSARAMSGALDADAAMLEEVRLARLFGLAQASLDGRA